MDANNVVYETSQKYIELAIRDADNMWKIITTAFKENPAIRNWDDNKKIEFFYEKNKEFYKEFPIVSRYMITMGQYSSKAFHKYLTLKALDAKNLPDSSQREAGYVEDKWVRREADYIMLLWKNMTKNKDSGRAKLVWEHAYESLKKEFSDFRDTYKQTELKIQEETKMSQKELVKEVISRLTVDGPIDPNITVDKDPNHGVIPPKSNDSDEKKKLLLEKLKAKLEQQRAAKNETVQSTESNEQVECSRLEAGSKAARSKSLI